MKKIPESYELDEADIKQAIALWIEHYHDPDALFQITLDAVEVGNSHGPRYEFKAYAVKK